MAKAKQETVYVRHIKAPPSWGVGMLVEKGYQQRTYLFADGVRRTFKDSAAELIVTAEAPALEDQTRMARGARGGGNTTPKAVHLALEAQIHAQPDDPQPFLVYADWLQKQGDPRGELITMQRARDAAPGDRKLERAEAALFEAHGTYFIPANLATLLAVPHRKGDVHAELSWRTGFFDRVRIVRRGSQPTLAEVMPELLGHPSAQFLRSLTIGSLGKREAHDYRPAISALAAHPHTMLRELVIGDAELEGSTGNAAVILRAAPALERLVVRADMVRLETQLKHGTLRELTIATRSFTRRSIDLLLAAQLPALEALDVTCAGHELPVRAVAELLARLPLRRLALRQTVHTTSLVHAIVDSPALARLESLVLRDGDLTDAIVDLFAVRRSTMPHLRELDLGGNPLSPEAVARLAEVAAPSRTAVIAVRASESRTSS